MRPELKAVVRAGGLARTTDDPVFSHTGTAGTWTVVAGIIGMGPVVGTRGHRADAGAGGLSTTSWWWASPADSIPRFAVGELIVPAGSGSIPTVRSTRPTPCPPGRPKAA